MSDEHSRPLIDQAQPILNLLKSADGKWVSRTELARTLGIARLNAYHVALLEYLLEKGLIEVSNEPARGPIGYKWMYRVKGGEK